MADLPSFAASSSSSSYTPVTALDKFGNAQQVRYAREAALRYGRLVLAAKYPPPTTREEDEEAECSVIVLTLVDVRPDLVMESAPLETTEQQSIQLLNHILPPAVRSLDTSPPNDHYQNHRQHALLALACTGIKPDAVWLMQTIRDYVKRIWQRYDTFHYSVDEMANAISQAMGSFWNHPRNLEWNHGAGPVVGNTERDDDEDDDNPAPWSRPLGVQALVLSTNPRDLLVVVEPSGVAQASATAVAIGQYSQQVIPQLFKKVSSLRRPIKSSDDLLDLMLQAVRQTVGSDFKKKMILIEILSSHGIERRWHS